MIALCREHADKADNGNFTDEQLRHLKKVGGARGRIVRARFDWMRHELLGVVGGNFYYKCPTILKIGSVDCISFTRDEEGYLLINLRMPTLAQRPRARIDENVWSIIPSASEVVAPPHGRLVEVKYANGDYFKAEFVPLESAEALHARYPKQNTRAWSREIAFPITAVEIVEIAAGTGLQFTPQGSQIGGLIMTNSFMNEVTTCFSFDVSEEEEKRLFPDEERWYEAMVAAIETVDTDVTSTIVFASSASHAHAYQAAHALNLGLNVQIAPVSPPCMVVILDIPESEPLPLQLSLRLTADDGTIVMSTQDEVSKPVEVPINVGPSDQYAMRGPGRRIRHVLVLDMGAPIELARGRTYEWALWAGEGVITGSAKFRVVSDAELALMTGQGERSNLSDDSQPDDA